MNPFTSTFIISDRLLKTSLSSSSLDRSAHNLSHEAHTSSRLREDTYSRRMPVCCDQSRGLRDVKKNELPGISEVTASVLPEASSQGSDVTHVVTEQKFSLANQIDRKLFNQIGFCPNRRCRRLHDHEGPDKVRELCGRSIPQSDTPADPQTNTKDLDHLHAYQPTNRPVCRPANQHQDQQKIAVGLVGNAKETRRRLLNRIRQPQQLKQVHQCQQKNHHACLGIQELVSNPSMKH